MKKIIVIVAIGIGLAHLAKAQKEADKKEEKLHIVIKESAKPIVYIDGIKYPHEVIDLIDNDKIESVSVLKDSKAMKEYDAPNGVIWIITKENTSEENELKVVGYRDSNKSSIDGDVKEKIRIRLEGEEKSQNPIIVVDGEVTDKGLHSIDPNKVKSITVLKGESASAKGYDAPNGVIIIETKKD